MSGKVVFSITQDQALILKAYAASAPADPYIGQQLTAFQKRSRHALTSKTLLAQPGATYEITDAGRALVMLLDRLAT